MPYREEEPWTFDLESIGCPEFLIECHDPLDLPSVYQRKVGQAFAISQRIQREIKARGLTGDDPIPDDVEEMPRWATEILDKFVHESIRHWNVTFPAKGDWKTRAGQVIPLDEPDLDFLDPVPGYVHREITHRLVGRLMAPPKSAV